MNVAAPLCRRGGPHIGGRDRWDIGRAGVGPPVPPVADAGRAAAGRADWHREADGISVHRRVTMGRGPIAVTPGGRDEHAVDPQLLVGHEHLRYEKLDADRASEADAVDLE